MRNPRPFSRLFAGITGATHAGEAPRGRDVGSDIGETVFDTVGEGVLVTDARKHIVDLNPAFTATTGWTLDELRGQHLSILRSDRHPPAFFLQLEDALRRDGKWIGEYWDRHKDGSINAKRLSVNAVTGDDGAVTNYVAVHTDINAQKRAEQELIRLAHTDALTELPNRTLFNDRLNMEIRRARRRGNACGLMILDLDRFKNINDTLGHHAGDIVLRTVSERLLECVRDEDTVARLAGDEFTVILGGLAKPENAVEVAQRIVRALSRPIACDGRDMTVTASVGIALYPQDSDDIDTLLSHAGKAMLAVKHSGRAGYRFYAADDGDSDEADVLRIETELRQALARDELELFFQPRFDLAKRRVHGAEALVRWRHPERGLVPPDAFIPIAEQTGLIVPLGRWVLRQACRQAVEWLAQGVIDGVISVNLSPRQLSDPALLDDIRTILDETGMAPQHLELELTESLVMDDAEASIALLDGLRAMGLSIAIDDFGTGHSSLAYLKRLPLHAVKIDRAFVRDIGCSSDDTTIIAAIIGLARGLNLTVVAEGIETLEQARLLLSQGCHELQGFFLAPPVPAADFPAVAARSEATADTIYGDGTDRPATFSLPIEKAS